MNAGDRIACQAIHRRRPDKEIDGCYTCGGYGYVYAWERACDHCDRLALFRPGQFTIYVGKKFTSADGLTVTYTGIDGAKATRICAYCDAKE